MASPQLCAQPTTSMPIPNPEPTDPFDTLLTLEDSLYTNAYTLGTQDGARAGRIEGRIFGLERGFEKFAALGELHGRSRVWGSRIGSDSAHTSSHSPSRSASESQTSGQREQNQDVGKEGSRESALPSLFKNPRLEKNIALLHALTDPETFSTQNTDEAVADFDDRVKRAAAKAKVIERIVGEAAVDATSPVTTEGVSPARKVRTVKVAGEGKGKGRKGDDSMEDFAGSRFLS